MYVQTKPKCEYLDFLILYCRRNPATSGEWFDSIPHFSCRDCTFIILLETLGEVWQEEKEEKITNTIVLMGRLARNPDIRQVSTQKGETRVARFPLVVKRNRTNKAFAVMITAYGSNAEFVEKYLEKGIKITLSGELVISQIKDEQTGTASYYTEVIMDCVEFAEAKTKKEESDGFQPAGKRQIPFDIPEELEKEMPFR